MYNQHIVYNFHVEIQGTGSRSEVRLASLKSSAVAKRPHDAVT